MILPDPEQFNIKDVIVGGDECLLITPNSMATDWTDDNARFRSCLIRKSDNHCISQGFSKFTNFSERPDFQKWDNEWPITAIRKMDGSLLCISKYKGELIIRTRGTIDARNMANGYEIDILVEKYPNLFDNPTLTGEQWTILAEWTTPTNIICLREHNEPTLTLLGVSWNKEPFYMDQLTVDALAKAWCIDRPTRYHYDSIEECIQDVETWKGVEGVVLYAPTGCYKNSDGKQDCYPIKNSTILKKIKASEYLMIHKICSGLNTIDKVIDLFLTTERFVDDKDFYNYIKTTLDFEIAEKLKDNIIAICKAYTTVMMKIGKVKHVVDGIRGDSFTRKDQAECIVEHWDDWRKSLAFLILDNREIPDTLIKTAIESQL